MIRQCVNLRNLTRLIGFSKNIEEIIFAMFFVLFFGMAKVKMLGFV